METIRLYSWDQLSTNFVTTNFTAYYDPNSTNQGTVYTGSILLTQAIIEQSSYSNDMKLVKVRVDWKTGNMSRTREFNSYISRCGLQSYIY